MPRCERYGDRSVAGEIRRIGDDRRVDLKRRSVPRQFYRRGSSVDRSGVQIVSVSGQNDAARVLAVIENRDALIRPARRGAELVAAVPGKVEPPPGLTGRARGRRSPHAAAGEIQHNAASDDAPVARDRYLL